MYYDTPRDFIGGTYDELLYGDQPLGWHVIGQEETVRAATRETFSTTDRWYRPERMIVGVGGRIEATLSRSSGAARRPRGGRDRRPPGRSDQRLRAGGKITTKQSTRRTSPRRPRLSARPSRPLRRPAADDDPRRRMSSRPFTEVRERRLAYYVFGFHNGHRRRSPAPGRRGHRLDRRRDRDDHAGAAADGGRARAFDELERRATRPRAGSPCSSRACTRC